MAQLQAGRVERRRRPTRSSCRRRPPGSPTSTAIWSSWPRATPRSPTDPGYQKAIAALARAGQARVVAAVGRRRRPEQGRRRASRPSRNSRPSPSGLELAAADLRGPARRHHAPRALPEEQRRASRPCATPTSPPTAPRRASRWCSTRPVQPRGDRRDQGHPRRLSPRPASTPSVEGDSAVLLDLQQRLQPRHDPGHDLRARRGASSCSSCCCGRSSRPST